MTYYNIYRQRLWIDAAGCTAKTLEEVYKWGNELVATLGVRERGRLSIEVNDLDNAEPGISMMILFLESGLHVHTWPGKKEVSLDIFSCKPYENRTIVISFIKFFQPKTIKVDSRK